MTSITLTRFNVNPRSYSYQDSYRACLDATAGANCHSIQSYMNGLMSQMQNHPGEPAAWSFSEWTRGNNTAEYWQAATAIVLEYRIKGDAAEIGLALHDRAVALGYAHIIMDSLSRQGDRTATIVFPLTERVTKEQYARLASILMEELGQYRAASGNMAFTHLIHVDHLCDQLFVSGAVIAPKAKIKETEKAYQNMDPRRFEAGGPAAAAHLVAPILTSHDGMFEWAPNAADKAQMDANTLLASIGVDLTAYGQLLPNNH